jgi:phasin family protein
MDQFFKGFQGFKFPQVDFNDFFAMQRKNLEAFSAANQIISEGAQTIARRGTEFVRENVEEALNASRDLMTTNAPEKNAGKQTEFAKSAVKNGLSQFREVTEMATKSQFEAFDILSNRFAASVEEAKTLAEKTAA